VLSEGSATPHAFTKHENAARGERKTKVLVTRAEQAGAFHHPAEQKRQPQAAYGSDALSALFTHPGGAAPDAPFGGLPVARSLLISTRADAENLYMRTANFDHCDLHLNLNMIEKPESIYAHAAPHALSEPAYPTDAASKTSEMSKLIGPGDGALATPRLLASQSAACQEKRCV
jgi:hypothetical protein